MHFDDLVAQYDYFLFDCDGVLWHGADQIDGSFDALAKLQGKTVIFITNASFKTRQEVCDKALGFGYKIPVECVYTSGYITAQYLLKNG